jgi:hypothetical protein
MKDWIIYPGVGIILALLVIFGWNFYMNIPVTPVVEPDGSISGNYSIESIEKLGKPFECSFSKSDGSSQVSGSIRMAESKLRGDFDINVASTSFASHFIITSSTTYTWTSLGPIGYKSLVAKSASKGASPIEQAQIIGTEDKEDYNCSPWNTDLSIFELPSGINFSEFKK